MTEQIDCDRTIENDGRNRTDNGLPIVDPATIDAEYGRTGPIAGVVLAAGTSTRFGVANKLLATIDGDPIVRRSAETLLASAVDRVIVVLGYQASRVREALADLPVEFVENARYENGQATSVRTGVRAVREGDFEAVVIALGDMPAVEGASIDALVAAYRADIADALATAYRGERGNPVCFDARHFPALSDVSGDTGGRSVLLTGERSALVETGDPGVVGDIDRPGDLDGYEPE